MHWLKRAKNAVDQEKKWKRVEQKRQALEEGSRVSPEEDLLAGGLAREGFQYQRQVKIETGLLAKDVGTPYYRVDFLVEDILVVEVDSYTHLLERKEWDRKKNAVLKCLGYQVLHLSNNQVNNELRGCLGKIEHIVEVPRQNGAD